MENKKLNGAKRMFLMMLLTVMILPAIVSSASITPAVVNLDYSAGLEETVNLNYKVTGYEEIEFTNECPELLSIGEVTTLDDGAKAFDVTITLPERTTEEGQKQCVVFVQEKRKKETSLINAVLRLGAAIRINFPYNEEHAQLTLDAPNTIKGEPLTVSLKIKNWGNKEETFKPELTIRNGNFAEQAYLPQITLSPLKEANLQKIFQTTSYNVGFYEAEATLTLNSQGFESKKTFAIGDFSAKITNYTKLVYVGELVPFDIEVQNWWKEPFQNVYAEIALENGEVAKSGLVNLKPWEKSTLTVYVNTANLQIKNQEAKIILHYQDKIEEFVANFELAKKHFYFTKLKNGIFTPYTLIIVLVILLNLEIFLLKRKRLKV